MTALFIEEVRKTGDFNLFNYYKRRVHRIMIPLAFSVAFTLPFALLISPDFTVGISKHVASVLSFTTNWYNIKIGSSYEAQLLPQLYVHTWSLAILMQFYLFWGAVCLLFSKLSKTVFKDNSEKRIRFLKLLIIAVSAAIAACSFAFMLSLYSVDSDLNIIYFNTLARLFPFFIGSAAAVIWGLNPKQDEKLKERFITNPKRPKQLIAMLISAIALIAALIVFYFSQHDFNDEFIYYYGFILTSILTVALIYGTHGLHILTPIEKKEPEALTVAAEMSYDMYLFHWPLFVVFSALIMDNNAAAFTALGVTLVFSALMVYGAEKVIIPQNKTRVIKYEQAVVLAIAIITSSAVTMGGFVLARAPAITSIESDFAVGHIAGDIGDILSLKSGVAAVNDSPVLYVMEGTRLQANLLPRPSVHDDNTAGVSQTVPQPRPSPPPQPPTAPQQPLQASLSAPAQETAQLPLSDPPAPSPQPTPTPGQPSPTPSPQPSATPPVQPSPTSSPDDTPTVPAEPGERLHNVPEGVTLIGDSVPLGARGTMLNRIPNSVVTAEVNRTVSQGLSIMTDMQNRNELREYVVIALGTNGVTNYADLFTRIIDNLNPGHRLIIVTPYDGRTNNNARWVNETAEWIRALPSQYDFITVADWSATIDAQVNLLAGDRVHMGGTGSMELYSDVVAAAISVASQKPAKS